MPTWLKRQRWMPVVAGIFSLYVLVLLANAYQSQAQLRSAAEARFLTDNQHAAAVLGDFLTEQRNFALYLVPR